MTVLNGVTIPEFNNFDEVLNLVDQNRDKVYLHFIEDDGKVQRNAILSHNKEDNTEYNQCDVKHCMECNSTNIEDNTCMDCNDVWGED